MKRIRKLSNYRLEFISLVAGTVVLAFELTASRVVAPYIGTTIYVWTSIIGIILAALALGYALGGYLADKRHKPEDIILMLLLASFLLTITNFVKDPLLTGIGSLPVGLQWQAFAASLLLFSLPTVVLGAISPYLVRLGLKDIAHSGRRVASISAAGTAGALLGTFLTGYVLFGFIGTRHILGLLAVILVLTSFLIRSRALLPAQVLLLAFTGLCAAAGPPAFVSGLQAEIDTKYSRVIIRDTHSAEGRPLRILQTDKQAWQSGVYKDGDAAPSFVYARSFAAATSLHPQPARILVIGGGAFTFPDYLAKTYPDAQIDVVELDGELASISERYFGVKLPDNVHVFHADGREFINHSQQKYDLIFMDAFSSLTPPFQLFTAQTAGRLEEALNPGGVVIANIVAAVRGPYSQFTAAALDTYGQHFDQVALFETSPGLRPTDIQNLTLIARSTPLPDQLSYVPPPGSKTRPAVFPRIKVQEWPVLVLRDDFAPVERIVSER